MKYPITIEDEPMLRRFIARISTPIARRAATEVLLQQGKIKPYMKKAECYRLCSRRKVDNALQSGQLPFTVKGKLMMIKREHFEDFLQTDIF